jgi:hypothetical protein
VAAPEVVRFPPRVIVEEPLFTPVPPLDAARTPVISEAGTVEDVVTADPAVETFTYPVLVRSPIIRPFLTLKSFSAIGSAFL